MRKSISIFAALVFCGGIASAQSEQQQQPSQSTEVKKPHPLDPADVTTITGRETNLSPFSRAPKPGHPLDPNDVATLTGRRPRSQWMMLAPKLGHALDPADVDTLSSNGDEGSRYRPFVTAYLTPELYANTWNVADPNFAPSQFESNSIFFPRTRAFPGRLIFPFSHRRSSFFFGNRFDGSIFFNQH